MERHGPAGQLVTRDVLGVPRELNTRILLDFKFRLCLTKRLVYTPNSANILARLIST